MDTKSPTSIHNPSVDDAREQVTPDSQESRPFSSSSEVAAERTVSNDKSMMTPKGASKRMENLSLPVVRLFSTTPQSSRLRRTSSPLRTTVTLDIQNSPMEACKSRSGSSRDHGPEGDAWIGSTIRRGNNFGSLFGSDCSPRQKGGSSSISRNPSTGKTARSALHSTPDKENVRAENTPSEATAKVTPQAEIRSKGRQTDAESADIPSPQSAQATRARSASLTPKYSPMQISPLPPYWPLQPLNDSGSRPPSTARPMSAADSSGSGIAADSCKTSASPRRPSSRPADSTAALELLADCAAAEAATSRKAKGADSLQVRDLLRASVRQAASAATQKSSAQSPQRSTVLWSLLRTSLKQQGEALLDLQSVKAVAKEAHREVRAREKVAAEHMQKAQTIARDARTYVKRQAAAYEQQKAQLAHKMDEMKDRESEVREQLEAQQKAVADANSKAEAAQAALSEVLAARRGAREALGEMAAQNARLVVGYCAKKAELKRLQEGLAAERARWEARLERLESGMYTGATVHSGKAYLSAQEDGSPARDSSKTASGSLRRLSEDEEAAWKSERARMQRDKAALQRECKALLERLKEYEPADGQQEDGEGSDVGTPVLQGRVLEFGARVAPGHGRRLSQGTSAADEQQPERRVLSDDQQRRIAEIEAQIHRLTAENAQLKQQQAEAEARTTAAERRRQVEEHKQAGNAEFQRGQHAKAVEEYTAALVLAQPDQGPLKAVLHCNRAAALHAMRRHIDAIADCYAAEALDPRYTRVLQRRADIYSAVGDHYSAMQDLTQLAGKGAYPEAMDRMSVAQRAAKLETEPNHYAVLGVPSTATTADIKQAFRQLALKYHPDKASTPGQKAASDKLFRLVSSAHTVLADKDQRRMFDLTLLRRQINARGRHVI